MNLPRNANLWLPAYLRDRARRLADPGKHKRLWVAFTDHFEPCGNATVNLEGDSDDVTLTGSCQAINVSGDSDHVVADSAGRVNLSGDADEVTVNSGSPAVTKTGIDDMVRAG